MDYISENKASKKEGGIQRNLTSDLASVISKKEKEMPAEKILIEKDIYDTFVEDIYIKQETYKIIVFKKRSDDKFVLEGAVKLIEET